ncbi:hypothetical protein AB432_018535 [Brevibacillus brevis]|uniref:SinR family protein n=1 Tax=Brevibacillus brevis TaxID=1393 RepID=A0A2Z4MKA2_BREBE|nr:hypothetical protein [Brevibacillus brevis]AWX56922.1 hypothetical protein AB432_018535 [Brevibacillus brevis]
MAVYLITYDLNKSGQNYDKLYEQIKSCGAWWHYLDSTWLVDSTLNATQIRDRMKNAMDDNDFCLVIKLTNENYQGWLPKKAWNWIHEHLGHSRY